MTGIHRVLIPTSKHPPRLAIHKDVMTKISCLHFSPYTVAFFLACASTASAQIVLTVNSSNHTFAWSGTATSIAYNIAEGSIVTFAIGNATSTGGIAFGGDGSIGVSSTFGSAFVPRAEAGNLVVNLPDTIATTVGLGFSSFGDGDISGTITVTGDAISHSLFLDSATQPSVTYLESQNGAPLYFLAGSTFSVSPFGSSIGQIVVVPEPDAVAAAVSLGLLGWVGVRRWRHAHRSS